MSEIIELSFNTKIIAFIIVHGNPWFKAREVATIPGYANTQ